MFIGRDKELSALDKLYKSDKFEFVVIYGACVKIGLNQEKPYK